MLEQYGVKWRGTRPIARLREAHHVMRTMLDERSIDFDGDFYSYSGVTTMAEPVQGHLPLKIGAMGGPKSMELAGEITDGLLTACAEWLTGTYAPAGLTHALVSFADPFTLRSWADVEVAGLPGLGEQVRLFGEEVLPGLAAA